MEYFKELVQFAADHQNQILALTAIGTLFISCVSLFVAVFAIWTQRRHDRNSVQPIAHIFVADYLEDIYVGIENVGMGPMKVKRVRFTTNTGETYPELVSAMPPLGPGNFWRTFSGDLIDYVFSPSGSMKFVRLSGDDTDPEFVRNRIAVRAALAEITVSVEFEDIYRHKFKNERELSFFKRETLPIVQ